MDVQLNQTAIDAIFDPPDGDGQFTYARTGYLRDLGKRRPLVLLAFPPKAAGTFLRQAAINAVDGTLTRITHAQGGRDAQPYLPTLIAYYHGGVSEGPLVAHVHMQGLTANISFVEAFGLRPVVMLRNIPDMLASYWDMLDTDPDALRQGLNCSIPAHWNEWAADDKADFMIDILGPWYASFFATWLDYGARPGNPVLLLSYKDFIAEPAATLEKILRHAGIRSSRTECSQAIETAWNGRSGLRFNQGAQGRGARYFKPHHVDRLARMLSSYRIPQHSRRELLEN